LHVGPGSTAAASSPLQMHLQTLYEDLWAQEKLFDETLPEEVKYWFEYTGLLQVSCAQI